jgi:hypothetical protein
MAIWGEVATSTSAQAAATAADHPSVRNREEVFTQMILTTAREP